MIRRIVPVVLAAAVLATAACGSGKAGVAPLDPNKLTIYNAQHANLMMGGIDGPLGTALGVPQNVWRGPVGQAASDLDRTGLASIPLTTMMTPQGVFAPRTSEKGRRFLAFINEPDSLSANPPASL